MKKLSVIALVLLLAAPCLWASVGVNDSNQVDGEVYVGEATNLYFEGQAVTFDGSKVTVLANGHKEGVTTIVASVSNLSTANIGFGTLVISSGTAKYVTLPNGTPGQMLTIINPTAGGQTVYITDDKVSATVAAALLATGWDDLAFTEANDSITLLYVDDTYGWIIIGNNSVTVT